MTAVPDSLGSPERLRELESLTRRYARYSRSAGGLSSVLGGSLGLVSYFTGGLLPLTMPLRIVLIAIPFVWLLAKGWLTHHYYQRFGHVEEQETRRERRRHRFAFGVTICATLLIISVLLTSGLHWASLRAGQIGYIVLALLIPVAVWYWLRSAFDFMIGVFLFCQAAVISAGYAYPLVGTTHTPWTTMVSLAVLFAPVTAVAMILAGVAEHRRFQRIVKRLVEVRQSG